MLRNYLTTALRNFWSQKGYTFINIAGLSIGLACSMLILLWIEDEVHFDKFHQHAEQLYRIMEDQTYSEGHVLTVQATPGPLAEALEEVPEITHAARISWNVAELFRYGDKINKEKGNYVDPQVFSMFSFPFLAGNSQTALSEPNTLVISRKLAEKYFTHVDQAIGKIIRIDNSWDVKVTGVFEDIPVNSSIRFDFAMPVKDLIERTGWLKGWDSNGIRTFIMLQAGASQAAIDTKIKDIVKKHHEQSNVSLFTQPITEMYLHSDFRQGKRGGGRIEYVRLFSVVAVFILVIACINFMNLATARSGLRAKEVGVRKTVGADQWSLFRQFISEALLLSFTALILAVALVSVLLPFFNELTNKEMQLDLTNPVYLAVLLGIGLFTGLLAGSYPAFNLSSLQAIKVLKGKLKTDASAAFLRKGLVVFQFFLSVFLIIGTLVIFKQIGFIKNKSLGYTKENLLYLPIEGDILKNYEAFRQELSGVPGVLSLTTSSQNPAHAGSNTSGIEWEGKSPDDQVLFTHYWANYDFIETMGMELIGGRSFSRSFGTDTAAILINEEAVRRMHLDDPVGKRVNVNGSEGTIIGVVKDFHSNSLHIPIEPAFIALRPEDSFYIFIRIASGSLEGTIRQIEQAYQKYNPAYPFEYHFMDETFEQLYRSETVIGTLANYFAAITIFISCLGLFGLAAFTAEQRTKEIGIRKVLGASVSNLTLLLSKDFLKLVLLAIGIATPLAWWAMHKWLEGYAYQVELGVDIFLMAGLAALLIALLTVSWQAIKAALMNPVKSLRSE